MLSLKEFIHLALQEDIGSGDHTSLACVPQQQMAKAKLLIKDTGILAGVDLAKEIIATIAPQTKISILIEDGQFVKPGDIAFKLEGFAQDILKIERLILNCMQRMSGIATYTRFLANKIAHLPTKILDTRKTTPCFRQIEKWAVRIGGGYNHRMGLYDMIMIKDNHIDYAGGIVTAIAQTKKYLIDNNLPLSIEIEARNMDEVKQIIATGGVHRIMLDNFSIADTQTAVTLINKRYEVESSGQINESNLLDYAQCGVDFVSIGALTHQIKSLDLSLKAD